MIILSINDKIGRGTFSCKEKENAIYSVYFGDKEGNDNLYWK